MGDIIDFTASSVYTIRIKTTKHDLSESMSTLNSALIYLESRGKRKEALEISYMIKFLGKIIENVESEV